MPAVRSHKIFLLKGLCVLLIIVLREKQRKKKIAIGASVVKSASCIVVRHMLMVTMESSDRCVISFLLLVV